MESVPLESEPLLNSVLGPMDSEVERDVRDSLLRVSAMLRLFPRRSGRATRGPSEGLHLDWLPSGQVGLSGHVSISTEGSELATLLVELTPGWYYGDHGRDPAWHIGTSVRVPCRHELDHGEQVVTERSDRARTPLGAAKLLEAHTAELLDWAAAIPADELKALTVVDRCET